MPAVSYNQTQSYTEELARDMALLGLSLQIKHMDQKRLRKEPNRSAVMEISFKDSECRSNRGLVFHVHKDAAGTAVISKTKAGVVRSLFSYFSPVSAETLEANEFFTALSTATSNELASRCLFQTGLEDKYPEIKRTLAPASQVFGDMFAVDEFPENKEVLRVAQELYMSGLSGASSPIVTFRAEPGKGPFTICTAAGWMSWHQEEKTWRMQTVYFDRTRTTDKAPKEALEYLEKQYKVCVMQNSTDLTGGNFRALEKAKKHAITPFRSAVKPFHPPVPETVLPEDELLALPEPLMETADQTARKFWQKH